MKNILLLLVFILSVTVLSAQGDSDHGAKHGLVTVRQIAENVYIHTSEQDVDGNLYPSNGLLVKTADGFVLLDTPWNDEQTEFLLNKVEADFGTKVIYAVITHSHDDRIGGIRTLIAHGITAVSSAMTAQFATKAGFPSPKVLDKTDTTIRIGGMVFELFYPGPGHTKDNITVYVQQPKVLFAACFLKSISANNIGNVADADINSWEASVTKLAAKYPKPAIVIPGHGPESGPDAYKHTIDIIKNYKKSLKK